MFLTVHALAAAVVVEKFQVHSSALAFVLGFGSHFILDMIPHGDEGLIDGAGKSYVRAVLPWAFGDLALLALLLLALGARKPDLFTAPVLLAMLGSMVPDALQVVHHALVPIPRYMEFHHRSHRYLGMRIGIGRGALLQGIFCLVMLSVLFRS